jgi:MFS family permease
VISEIREIMKGNVLVLTVCSTMWRMSVDMVWQYLALYIIFLGGEYETIGQVMAVGNVASMLLYPLGGYLADYQGRIKVMGYMTYVYAFTFLIYVFTDTWQWVAVGIFMQSFVTFYFPAMQALMADSIPEDKRGLGFAATMAIPGAFGIASPMIGGWLIEIWGINRAFKTLYAVGFVVALIVATLRLKFLKETREPVEGEKQVQIRIRKVPGLVYESYKDMIKIVREAPRRVITFSVLVSTVAFFVSMASPFWIIRATEIIGVNEKQWGFYGMINGALNVVLSFPAGKMVDKWNKKMVAGISLIVTAIPCYLFLYAREPIHVLALLMVATIPNTFINPAFQALFTEMVPPETRGRMFAALGGAGIWVTGGAWATGMVAMVSITLGTLASGYIYRFNNSLPWIILSVSMVVLGVLIMVMIKDKELDEHL